MIQDVAVFDSIVEKDFCQRVINLFEMEEKKIESARYAFSQGDLPSETIVISEQIAAARRGRVAVCGDGPSWTGVRERFSRAAGEAFARFAITNSGIASLYEERFILTVPRIEKICEGGGFEWHMDSRHVRDDRRFLTFVFYLNDVLEGGETEFLRTGEKVEPRTGRVLLLPPFWTHIHRGRSPVGVAKYTASMFAARDD